MIKSIFSAAIQNVKTNLAHFRKLNSIGLNPVYIKYLKVVKNTKITSYELFGHQLSYVNNVDLLHSLREIFLEEVYKIDLAPGSLIIDCGANIGLSVIYFKRRFPDVKIIAYEPDNMNYELIKKNVSSFGLNDVDIRKEAVWDKEEVLSFKSVGSLGSMISSDSAADTYKVNAIRLKNILNQKIGLLKMDIEGAEYPVLCDIKDDLKNVGNIFIEYHGKFEEQYKLQDILDIINKAGFFYYIKEAWNIFKTPFSRPENNHSYDVQLNIFCFKEIVA